MYNPFSLEGKTILITGASSGIGRSTAIECAKMGAKLLISGRNEERLKDTFSHLEGEGHQMIVSDLLQQEGLDSLVGACPKLDGAVLCAGIGVMLPIQFSSREKFDKVFNTNFFAQTELTRLLYKGKKFNKQSSLVFIASIGGNTSYTFGNCIYGTSKAALNSFMKFCAKEFAQKEIRVNSICPGTINTPLTAPGTISEEQRSEYLNKHLIKRFGEPEEVAYGAIYLLSNASSWITGTSIFIDGGGDNN